MENKYLQKIDDGIFSKIFNSIKRFFYRNKNNTNVSQEDENLNREKDGKEEFLSYVRMEKKEDSRLIELQKKFENNNLENITTEELKELEEFYDKQYEEIQKDIENKLTTINMMKRQLNSYVENDA